MPCPIWNKPNLNIVSKFMLEICSGEDLRLDKLSTISRRGFRELFLSRGKIHAARLGVNFSS